MSLFVNYSLPVSRTFHSVRDRPQHMVASCRKEGVMAWLPPAKPTFRFYVLFVLKIGRCLA